MLVRRYGQPSRSVLHGANAAPLVWSARRKRPREVDWSRLQPGDTTVVPETVASEKGYVVAISLTMETPPRPK